MNIYEFMSKSPWLTFFLAFLLVHLIVKIVYLPINFYRNKSRRLNIAAHGWPTAPVDADGDVVYPKKES